MWKVTYAGESNPTDFQVKADDAYSGETSFHFWSADSDMEFSIEQEFTDLEPERISLPFMRRAVMCLRIPQWNCMRS